MNNTKLKDENIYFYDEISTALDKIPSNALFVVDKNVHDLTDDLSFFLQDKRVLILELDEVKKNLAAVEQIYHFLFLHQTTEPLVVIGGGIIGDVALFASATFKRGISCIMVPTTLLSMVDSAVGGKSGVNFKGIKNYIGVFKKPDEVLIVPEFLETLTEKERRSGMGELLKYGLLGEDHIFDILMESRDWESLPYLELITRALLFKVEVVSKDFRDTSYRNILNLGHNTAHGLESLFTDNITHGEAVALGLIVELALSEKLFDLDQSIHKALKKTMKNFGMKTKIKIKDVHLLIQAMEKDKKNDEVMRFTLLKDKGKPIIKIAVEEEDLVLAFNEIME